MRKEFLPKILFVFVDLLDKFFLMICPIFYMSLTRAQDSNDRFTLGVELIKKLNRNNEINILDVGCGSGNFFIYLNASIKNFFYKGIDFNINQIKSSKIDKNNFKIFNQDLRKNWFFGEFDFVWSSEVIEHIIDDNSFFENLTKSTKKNGYIIITTPHYESYINFADKFKWTKEVSKVEDGGHVKLGYNLNELENFAKKFDLKLIETYLITECDNFRAKNLTEFNQGFKCYLFNVLYLLGFYKYKKFVSYKNADSKLKYYCIGAVYQKKN